MSVEFWQNGFVAIKEEGNNGFERVASQYMTHWWRCAQRHHGRIGKESEKQLEQGICLRKANFGVWVQQVSLQYSITVYSDSIVLFQSRDSIVCLTIHFLRCCALAERAFGRTHNATVALRARLGDVGTLEGAKNGG